MESFKPRDQHQGPETVHLGQSHIESDAVKNAARDVDAGPSFGTPGDPPEPDPESLEKIANAYEDRSGEDGVPRSG